VFAQLNPNSPGDAVIVSEHQLQFDLDALAARLADGLRDRRHHGRDGAERLLVALVRQGLDETDLVAAAALAIALDQPNHNQQEDR
jgi:hypothetical protein